MESGLEGGGDGFFGDGEVIDAYGEARPFSAFECKEEFVDIAETVLAAGESGLNGLGDRERAKDFGDGLVQQCVGDGKNAHEKEIRFFVVHSSGPGKLFAEEGTGQGSAGEFGSFVGSEGNDGKDGDPAAEFAIADESKGMTNAVGFGTKAE